MFHCVGPNKTPSRKRKSQMNTEDQEHQGPSGPGFHPDGPNGPWVQPDAPCGPRVHTVSPSTVLANPMKSMRLSPVVKCTGKGALSLTESDEHDDEDTRTSTPITPRPPTSGKGEYSSHATFLIFKTFTHLNSPFFP